MCTIEPATLFAINTNFYHSLASRILNTGPIHGVVMFTSSIPYMYFYWLAVNVHVAEMNHRPGRSITVVML